MKNTRKSLSIAIFIAALILLICTIKVSFWGIDVDVHVIEDGAFKKSDSFDKAFDEAFDF